MEEIKKLDNDEIENIYIRYQDHEKLWTVPKKAAVHSKLINDIMIDNVNNNDSYGSKLSPIIISNIKFDTIDFMIRYMMYYNNKIEKCAPEGPLKNIHISIVFGDEFELFKDIYELDKPLKEKFIYINYLIESAIYFG